jgi:secreted trypsin-like serine protease
MAMRRQGSDEGRRAGCPRLINTCSGRLVSALTACAAMLTLLLACSSQPALAASSPGASLQSDSSTPGQLVPYIVGGQESPISRFPWQVYVAGRHPEGGGMVDVTSCGGSILNATTILTAAHCVDHEGTTTTYAAGEFAVLAGASNVSPFTELYGATGLAVAPSGGQALRVSHIRTDPYYSVLPNIKDDVAILTLENPLELSEENHAQAISLVPAGATPAPGTTLSISGYGKQEGAESALPNGELYSTTLTAISSDACRDQVGINSAVLLCAVSPQSSTCQGDSGGPLTEGSPAVQVGIVDFGAKECPVGSPDAFTNIAAPEVRDFIEGSETPPIAARPASPPAIKQIPAGGPPVDFSPLTCEPGAWSEAPSFTYTFQEENASAQVLQSGPSNLFTPPSTLVGVPVVCIVQASNAGGVSTARSTTTAAIAADSAPPSAKLTSLRCHLQVCTLSFTASDPDGVALSVQSSATYSVFTRCAEKKKKKRGRKSAKQPVCRNTQTVSMPTATLSPGSFQASVSRLPYGVSTVFIIDVSNAAGLQAQPLSEQITLRKPKPKQAKKKSRKHRSRRSTR